LISTYLSKYYTVKKNNSKVCYVSDCLSIHPQHQYSLHPAWPNPRLLVPSRGNITPFSSRGNITPISLYCFHHPLLPVQANTMYKTAEEEEDVEETAPPSPHSKFDKKFETANDAVNATQPPPHATFDIEGMMKYSKHFDPSVVRNVLGEFFLIHPIMIDCLFKLRHIYVDNPDKECPIQILLIISMLEFIVAYALSETGGTSLQEYITFIREQWGLVGEYINCKCKSKKMDSSLIS